MRGRGSSCGGFGTRTLQGFSSLVSCHTFHFPVLLRDFTKSNDDHQQKLNLLSHTNIHPTLKHPSSGAIKLVKVAHRGLVWFNNLPRWLSESIVDGSELKPGAQAKKGRTHLPKSTMCAQVTLCINELADFCVFWFPNLNSTVTANTAV